MRVNAICNVTSEMQNDDSSGAVEPHESVRILLVGQSASANEWVSKSLTKEFASRVHIGTASRAEFETKLTRDKYDVALYQAIPDVSDIRRVLEAVRMFPLRPRLIVLVEPGFEELAVEVSRQGTADYVLKTPKYVERVPSIVRNALRMRELDRQQQEITQLAARGWLSAQIAHEINNPLAGIKNSFLLLKDLISPEHRYYEYVGLIEKELERISCAIHQMYDLYRPDRAVPREFCVRTLCQDVATLLEPSGRQRCVPIVIDPIDPAVHIKAPEACVSQVLINVVQNAIEASAPNQEVRMSVTATDTHCYIAVTDRGCGISEDMRDCVFQPFFTTKQGSGDGNLGLGLAVSQKLVQSMHGTLAYKSRVGGGTTFQIRLPWN